MKLTEIGSLRITESGKIVHNRFTLKFMLKAIATAVGIAVIAAAAYTAVIRHEENLIREQKLQASYQTALEDQSGSLIQSTAELIVHKFGLPVKIAEQYTKWIFAAAYKYAVDPFLILSVISVESGFNYKAVSPTGPIGLMQVAASHHREKASPAELFDPRKNIDVGTQILAEYSKRSSSQVETLLRYNGSLGSAPVYATKVIGRKLAYEQEALNMLIDKE